MEETNELLTEVSGMLWGWPMIALLLGTHILLTIRLRFPQRHIFKAIRLSVQKDGNATGEVSQFGALATALAATIGTGNIVGVGTAIHLGGAGALFWMWVSALLGMVTKYSEIVLSIHFREKNKKGEWVGGPMYYIRNGLKVKWLAVAFAIFAMIACLGTGNATQSNSIAVALESTVGIKVWITGLVLTVIAAAVILGGMRRIASVNEKLVPVMAVFYVLASLIALVVNADKIPGAFSLIFKEAFNFRAAAGGAGQKIRRSSASVRDAAAQQAKAGADQAPVAAPVEPAPVTPAPVTPAPEG